jgi:excisionase family DNA binding protein
MVQELFSKPAIVRNLRIGLMQNDLGIEVLFTLPEASRLLGFERSTVFDRIKNGRLKAVKLDGRVRIPRSEVIRYLAQATPISA